MVITEIANSIYDTGQIPEQMAQSIFMTLSKKPGAIECDEFRAISLMSQLSKAVLRTILNGSRNKVEAEIAEEQFGFMKGEGTCNAISIIKLLGEGPSKCKRIYSCVSLIIKMHLIQ